MDAIRKPLIHPFGDTVSEVSESTVTHVMHISPAVREAIWRYSDRCVGFLHIPKAAGTTVRSTLGRSGALLNLEIAETPHGPDCQCSAARCRARRKHERLFLRRVKASRKLWCLDFGHRPITNAELQSLPKGLSVLVPLRPTQDRLESYLRYYFLMANAATSSHVVTFDERGITWNLRRAQGRANLPRLSLNWSQIETVRSFRYWPTVYVNPDGTVALHRWVTDAALSLGHPFLYRDLLPDLSEAQDLHSQFLRPMPVPQLLRWLGQEFDVQFGMLNQSSGVANPWLASTDMTEFTKIKREFSLLDDQVWEILVRLT